MVAKSLLASGLLFVAGAMANNNGATTPTPAAGTPATGADGKMVMVQVVKVSDMNSTLKFDPEEITAEAGSMVQFQFFPKNHTVTQSTFDRPCEPINSVMSNVTGINSGPMPPENGMMKIFTIMVNDTKPMWMYCATADHCQKGMVMAINPPATGERNLQAFKAAAAQVPASGGNSTAPGNGTAPGTPEGAAADGQAAEGVAASSMVNLVVGSTGIVAFVAATFALLL